MGNRYLQQYLSAMREASEKDDNPDESKMLQTCMYLLQHRYYFPFYLLFMWEHNTHVFQFDFFLSLRSKFHDVFPV